MIRPINISPLNTSRELQYECGSCQAKGVLHLENSIINVNNDLHPLEEMDYDCPHCGRRL
jgi:DNA-directed RNA polymerase subunit RPC12/RpoP